MTDPREHLTRRAVIVWAGAMLFYVFAVLGRTSFGVAGVDAIERFGVDASRIAVFTAVQIGVYALAQIPTGLLIDRFGPKKVLVTGAVIMAVGQLVLGLTTSYWVAIAARVLIGAGDATAFLSAMRILPFWFPLRLTPLFTQLTASLGQLGQLLSAVPFLWLLGAQGWTVAFVSLGAVGLLVALVGGLAVADAPTDAAGTVEVTEKLGIGTALRIVLSSPVCWQAFFIHYTSMLFQINFNLLWGAPMMTEGMGLTAANVGVVLTVSTLVGAVTGPLVGVISQRAGQNRDLVALTSTLIQGATWMIFFLSPTPRGLGAVLVVIVIIAMFTLTSNYGFDYVRELLPRSVVAAGTGLGNMGAFLASMVSAQLVGLMLDYSADGQAYGWLDFRFAWLAVFAVWAVGVTGLLISRAAVKRQVRDR